MQALRAPSSVFEQAYARFASPVLAYAFSILRDLHAAEDVLQDSFLRLHRRLVETGGPDGEPSRFLFGVARSRIIDRLRRRRVQGEVVSLAAADEPEQIGPTRTEGVAEQAEVHRLINRALLGLPPEQREVVVLRIFGGMSFEAVASLTEAPLATAASRYRYALQKMAPMLKELWVEDRR